MELCQFVLSLSGSMFLCMQEEDATLRRLVERGGAKGWTAIAQHLPGRAGKQCRERWHNHLKRGIKKVCPWHYNTVALSFYSCVHCTQQERSLCSVIDIPRQGGAAFVLEGSTGKVCLCPVALQHPGQGLRCSWL